MTAPKSAEPGLQVAAATEVDAPPQVVWGALTDLAAFQVWNPFIRRAFGSTEVGGTVHVRVRPASLRLPFALPFSARITERIDARALRWSGRVLGRWFAAGDHRFDLEPLPGGRTRLVQTERFTGLLPRIAWRLLARETERGFLAMNRALADRVGRRPA